jgi:hypothetical protein
LFLGWRPRRSVIFCSWGAEEFGLVGSYEWVEVKHRYSYIFFEINFNYCDKCRKLVSQEISQFRKCFAGT